ncbi:hypothetical protein D9757_005722 [Collybiopsis confluens]|uniref:F-box domain-containing protein n=1 Tax=Collybiopsis confluens TaxID=2823264 RepID=A0A8H5HQI8_9AGAR|nr:hypothetical protein D9757_005722 [Collybiopsis confluens]
MENPAHLQPPSFLETLPNELLAKIFLAGVDLDNSLTPLARPSLISYCSVSSRWRALCQSTPELWTIIRVPFEQTRHQDVVAWTTTWLERSKSCLFDFIVDFQISRLGPSVMRHAMAVMSALAPHVARLRKFHFAADQPWGPIQSLFRTTSNSPIVASELKDLQLHLLGDVGFYLQNSTYPICFKAAPRLQRQSLRSVPVPLPMHGLTVLRIEYIVVNEQELRVLAVNSPALEELALTQLYPSTQPLDLKSPKIVFPTLCSLTVSFRQIPRPVAGVFALMSTPNLSYLQIRGICQPDPFVSFPDPATLTNLHTLCLNDITLNSSQSGGVSRNDALFYLSLPSVKHLQLISTPPQSLFPEQDATRKPVLKSRRSGELRSHFNRPSPSSSLAPRANEIDLQTLTRAQWPTVKLPLSPQKSLSTSATVPYNHWPNLTTITLDTIRAKDLLWLCELVASRPEIETVYLSHSAKRHLASSLSMWKGDPASNTKGSLSSWDANLQLKPLRLSRYNVEHGDMAPADWLEKHVQVLDYNVTK